MASAITEQECRVCTKVLAISLFPRYKSRKTGYDSRCKSCRNAAARSQYSKDRREYNKNNVFKWRLSREYGIDVTTWNRMVEEQNSCCAICGTQERDPRKLHVDHDHKTGVVRQLLCNNCNVGIGYFKDNQERLLRAAAYLQRHNSNGAEPEIPLALVERN